MLNGIADFLSIGLTRWSLRKGTAGLLPLSAVIDLIGAIVIFALLGGSIITIIHFVRPMDGVPLLDLSLLFTELNDPDLRGGYWWLLFMLFSTLIPTVLHLIIAAIAFFTIYPKRIRTKIATWLDKGPTDVLAARSGRLALSCAITAAVMIPTFVIVESIRWAPGILNGTIWVFETFARAIGAI